MATTIDHLLMDHWIHVLKSFQDARDKYHAEGEKGLVKSQRFDSSTQEIQIEWERDKERETLYFALASQTGPGIGRMKEYFKLGEYDPPVRPELKFIPELNYFTSATFELPPLTDEFIHDENRGEEALQRVCALAGRKRFAEAREQLLAIPMRWADLTAKKLGEAAQLHVFDEDGEVYEWLRDWSTDHWYCWGSQATSGGDGASRLLQIDPAMERFKKLDKFRESLARSQPNDLGKGS